MTIWGTHKIENQSFSQMDWAREANDGGEPGRHPSMVALLPASLREVWADPPASPGYHPGSPSGRLRVRPPPRPSQALPGPESAPLSRDFDESLTFQGEIELPESGSVTHQLYQVEFNANRSPMFHAPGRVRVNVGDYVLTEADRGFDVGRVVGIVTRPSPRDATGAKVIVRVATRNEIQQLPQKAEREARALELCRAKTAELGLPMNITGAEFQFDGKKLTFYYTAGSYVDFRHLVRTLFKIFGTRIWMVWCDGSGDASVGGGCAGCAGVGGGSG
jgi:hypothetical protein